MKRLPPDWAHLLANVDYQTRLALLAEHGDPETPTLIGVARYEPTDRPDTAEIAFVIQDGWQNRGLGTIMLDALLAAAEARGIRRFRAYVLASNTRMLDLFARFTDVRERKTESGVTELLLRRRRPRRAAALRTTLGTGKAVRIPPERTPAGRIAHEPRRPEVQVRREPGLLDVLVPPGLVVEALAHEVADLRRQRARPAGAPAPGPPARRSAGACRAPAGPRAVRAASPGLPRAR